MISNDSETGEKVADYEMRFGNLYAAMQFATIFGTTLALPVAGIGGVTAR